MNDIRLKRLDSDEEAVRRLVRLHPRIDIEGISGDPPDRYVLILKTPGLRASGEELTGASEHKLEVKLSNTYPRDAPVCRMLTPVFHPNIAPHAVCIADHWTAAEALDLLIQRVGEMISFQSYNVQSPLNGKAAQWAIENSHRLPLLRKEFYVDVRKIEHPDGTAGTTAKCSNCGTENQQGKKCPNGHDICPDCELHCETCGRLLCLKCGETRCPDCEPTCVNCGSDSGVIQRCSSGHQICQECSIECPQCGKLLCLLCGEPPCSQCGSTL